MSIEIGQGSNVRDYEVREINGQNVFVKKICSQFYLINNVSAVLPEDLELDDDVILDFLNEKNHPLDPYDGAENEGVVSWDRDSAGDTFIRSLWHLHNLKDPALADDARRAYDEYKAWTGISGGGDAAVPG